MAEESKVNIMSVELAIQRELAYREKIARDLSQEEAANLLSLKVPSSTTFATTDPTPMHFVGQSSISPPRPVPGRCLISAPKPLHEGKFSTPGPGSGSGEGSSSSLSCPQNLQLVPYHIPNRTDMFCKICKVSCSSRFNYKQHLRGQKHKAKLKFPQLDKNGMYGPNKHQQPRCNLCQILCSDENSLDLHFKGQKHKAKLQEVERGKKRNMSQQFWCDFCHVPCTNEDSFKLHLMGKNHAALIRALGEEKKTI